MSIFLARVESVLTSLLLLSPDLMIFTQYYWLNVGGYRLRLNSLNSHGGAGRRSPLASKILALRINFQLLPYPFIIIILSPEAVVDHRVFCSRARCCGLCLIC